jgi:translation elongation factor EF-Ts
MDGRIEAYMHSDSTTQNKAGCLIKVTCQTDFAAKTQQFIEFSKEIAKYCFGSGSDKWEDVVAMFPELEIKREALAKELKEKVAIEEIVVVKLV